MWMLDLLYQAMPENWAVYQEFMFADATTFLSYNNNMRQLVYDKLKSCELVVFNRFQPDMDKMAFHKIVRGASRRSDIAYEYANGKVVYDDIQDPLPFDVNAPVIQINDEDYALWYRDMSEEPKKYEGKTVKFKCRALKRGKLPKGCFVVGRHVMTCCVEDIQFAGLVCQWDKADLGPGRELDDPHGEDQLQVPPGLRQAGTGADLPGQRPHFRPRPGRGDVLLKGIDNSE